MKIAYTLLLSIALLPLAQAQPTKNAQAPTPVIVSEVVLSDFSDELEAIGTLKANESVDLASSVTELITAIKFSDNQRVKKGDVLIEMDAIEERAELAEQQSYLREASKQVNRLTPLVKRGAAPDSILDEKKRELASAKARINAIASRIDQRTVKAPFDGVLGLRNISLGTLTQPGSLITTIDDDLIMKLDFSVPEVFLASLKPGVIVEAKTRAYPNKLFTGKITSIDSRIDPVTRSIKARALLDNQESLLKPGLLMQINLQKNPRKALVIPEEALIADRSDNFVLVIKLEGEKTTSERRKVELGTRKFGIAEILSGLTPGEKIITHGTLRVRPGAPLVITAVESDKQSLESLLKQTPTDKKQTSESR